MRASAGAALFWLLAAVPQAPAHYRHERGHLLSDPSVTPGALVATVEGLPASDGIHPAITGNRIALAGTDSAGVPVVRMYRLTQR